MAIAVRRALSPGAMARRGGDPFQDLEEVQSRVERLMESMMSGTAIPDAGLWVPPADIEETDDAWVLEAELPGVDREDVNVDMRDNELAISGEIKDRERTGILRRRARRVGRFEFRVRLPGDVNPDGIDASLDNGVLTVRVPKGERAQPRRIEVKSGQPAGAQAGQAEGAQAGQTEGG